MKKHRTLLFVLVAALLAIAHGCALIPVAIATGFGVWVGLTLTGVLGFVFGAATAAAIVKCWDSIEAWWGSTWFGGGAEKAKEAASDAVDVTKAAIEHKAQEAGFNWLLLLWLAPLGLLFGWLLWKRRRQIDHIAEGALEDLDKHVGPKDPPK